MRKLVLMVGLVVVAIACATGADMVGEMMDSGVPDAGAQPGTPVGEFVGYTSEAHTLGRRTVPTSGANVGGLFDSYAACQADFGASARICTTAEVLGTANLPAAPPVGGPGSGSDDPAEGGWVVETLAAVPACWGEDPYNTNGPYLTPRGTFASGRCIVLRVLACCTVN
jgi:hypothetical protein